MRSRLRGAAVVSLLSAACFRATGSGSEPDRAWDLLVPLGLPAPQVPPGNPLTEAKVDLGRRLFFEKRLSRDGSVSCSSCHVPEKSFQNGETFARGAGGARGTRNVPTLVNRAFGKRQFWDGRAPSLEEQVSGPLEGRSEMDNTWEAALRFLNGAPEYRLGFLGAFGGPATRHNVSMAIASYERTLLSGNSAYDRYAAGRKEALGPLARRGRELFFGKFQCAQCHPAPTFSDEKMNHRCYPAFANRDPAAAGKPSAPPRGPRVKTPTLRDVARTAPYLHNGSLATIGQVLDFYSQSAAEPLAAGKDADAFAMNAEEKAALAAFLESLTGESAALASADGRKL
ncbi:MAG: cytochrome-c peroxidase [Elusimicrobia bacterium]|nr:cytochrome-c peroxidase [Elusimicrobiota bacterium]